MLCGAVAWLVAIAARLGVKLGQARARGRPSSGAFAEAASDAATHQQAQSLNATGFMGGGLPQLFSFPSVSSFFYVCTAEGAKAFRVGFATWRKEVTADNNPDD